MKKFILVDQSIKDAGGHHLEYALRVMTAAKRCGFMTILATNKDCEKINNDAVDMVERVFTHTFWQNYQSEAVGFIPKEQRYFKKVKYTIIQIINALMSSSLGFSYIAATQGLSIVDMLSRYGSAAAGNRLPVFAILAGYGFARIKCLLRKVSPYLNGTSNFLKPVFRVALFIPVGMVGLLCLPVLLSCFLFFRRKIFFSADEHSLKFANDLKNMLIRINAEDYDILFIPTLGNVELFGAGICIRDFPALRLGWHFLFRRNIFYGREPLYQGQIEKELKTVRSFYALKEQIHDAEINFYTDTVGLTEQYNRLGAFEFKTLPIPLDNTLKRIDSESKFLKIVYIGDARDEKGFPFLARLVNDLSAAGYSKSDIRFLFQSNFNVPGGEAGSRIALSQLLLDSPEWISLLEGPFESREYTALVNEADIILIPYNNDSYYVRSSGIFAEALAAGVPVVSSDKSWMSRELLKINQDYYCQLLHEKNILQTIFFTDHRRHSRRVIRPRALQGYVWLLIKIEQLFEKPGQYLNIYWKTSPLHIKKVDRNNNFYSEFAVDLRLQATYALLCLPAAERILLEFQLDDGMGNKSFISKTNSVDFSINIYELDLHDNQNLFKIGALFSCEEDFSTAVIELIEHHKQYVIDAKRFMKNWLKFHSSEVLVKLLIGV